MRRHCAGKALGRELEVFLEVVGQVFAYQVRSAGVAGDALCVVDGILQQALDLALAGEQTFEFHHLAAFERSVHGVLHSAFSALFHSRSSSCLRSSPVCFLSAPEMRKCRKVRASGTMTSRPASSEGGAGCAVLYDKVAGGRALLSLRRRGASGRPLALAIHQRPEAIHRTQ